MAYVISSGDLESGIILENDTMTVLDGGIATETSVNSSGYLYISSGGTADSTMVNSGSMYVSSGGTANSTTVNEWGYLHVSSGGTANSTTVNAGYLVVSSGGTADSATVNSWGYLYVSSGGTANNTTVNDGGDLYVSSGGTANSTTVNAGYLVVSSGGTATDTTINSNGYLHVYSGGIANAIIENGGDVYVADEANTVFISNTFSGLILNLNDSATVHSGTTANSTTVNNGGGLRVYSGGAANEIIENGGWVYVADGANAIFASNTFSGLILSNASATVHSGTTANNTTVNFSGYLCVYSGGTADNTIVNSAGYFDVYSGGTADNTIVNSSGYLYVTSGGTANSTTVNSGGRLYVPNGGTANEILENGGYVYIEDGADAVFVSNTFSGLVIYGVATVHSGTTATSTTVNDWGSMFISSGGTADNTIVNSSGFFCVASGGTADSTTVNSKGSMYVSNGGVANSATVSSGGRLEVYSGGAANEIIENGGWVYVADGANAIFASNTFSGLILSRASATVHSGTTANSTTVNNGYLCVYSGGTADNTIVNSSGYLYVTSGGTATDTTINSNGYLDVYSGGTVDNTIVNTGGSMYVPGGLANSTTVNSGGNLNISSGGKMTGRMIFESGAVVSALKGSILDFDLTEATPGNNALVNDLSFVRGTPVYTITVDAELSTGLYLLADGTDSFDGTITVLNTAGDELGMLSLATPVEIFGISYTLSLFAGELTLAVGCEPPQSTAVISSGVILTDETRNVNSGELYYRPVVNTGGELNVQSGGTAKIVNVNENGNLIVSSGGTANSTTVNASGRFYVYSGGTANNTTVNFGGSLVISRGVTANSTTVNSRGYLYVSSGGTATEIKENGGYIDVQDGANVTFVPHTFSGLVLARASATVHSGTTANSTTVNSGGFLEVSSGGTADNTTVNSGGFLEVSSGGTADNTTVKSSGCMYVSSGGIANNTTVNGSYYGGRFYVASGGTANSATVNFSGYLTVSSGGTANSATVNFSGYLTVSSGGTATGIVENGGYVDVQDGANVVFASNTFSCLILSNGSATVHSGTTALMTDIGSGMNETKKASLLVYGGVASDTNINARGSMFVSSGGIANNTTVNSNGSMLVSSDGTANSTTIHSGGRLSISGGGTANSTTVNSNGSMLVFSGGTANSTTIHSGGRLSISGGGTANSTTVNSNGSMLVFSGGTAKSTTIHSGGRLSVSGGGTANSTTVNPYGKLYVSKGGTATEIMENGGYVEVRDIADVTFASNAFSGLILSSASATVHSGTTAFDTMVNSGGRLHVYSGGTASSTTVNGGRLNVDEGGTASSTTVNAGGNLSIRSGGTATDIVWTPCEGHVYVDDGGIATFVNQYSGVYYGSGNKLLSNAVEIESMTLNYSEEMYVMSGGTVNSTTVNGGYLHVFIGGTVNSTTVNADGYLGISSGGTVNSTTVNSSGNLYVSNGGMAHSTTVNSGGYLSVDSGGTATNIITSSGASLGLTVASDTYIQGTSDGVAFEMKNAFISGYTVRDGSYLEVYSGGMATDTMVNSGGNLIVSSGGTAKGRMQFESGADVWMEEGAVLDFDLTQVEAGEMALVNDLSIVLGSPIYTLTVGADSWKPGSYVYVLADGAYNFASTISVVNTAGDELGVLTVGETVRIGYDDYTLNLNEGALTVTVDVPDLPPTAPDGLQAIVSDQTVALLWNVSTDEDTGVKEYVVTYSLDGQEYTVRTQNTHYVLNGADYGTWSWSVKAVDFAGNESGISVGEAFTVANFEPYIVEYSTDSFEHVLRLKVSSAALDSFRLPTGTYEWRMRAESEADWQAGDPIVSVADSTPTFVQSDADGADDLFFANACGVWETGYLAQHGGSIGDWDGTLEYAAVFGKNKLADIFEGSDDANILLLTDDSNGDGLFVDDIYTELPGTLEEQQARIARIDEIRAGAGDDIIDMTSQRFEYIGDGILLRGGDGNDVLWANKGDNTLFGDAGNDRIVGASGDDLIAGGIGDDRMHGGGGNDFFTFCEDWGKDTVEHLATGSVTLWFASGDLANWDADSLTYTDGENKVTVKGVTAEQVTLKFGDDGSAQFTSLSDMGAFDAFTSRKIFEEATLA